MNEILKTNAQTISTLEIAEMMEVEHYKVIRKIEGDKDRKGYYQILADSHLGVSDYFIPSFYKDASGKENKCYEVTKIGCDFLANKFTGEKGILFTARYVKRFDDMENYIKDSSVSKSSIEQGIAVVKFIADDLRVSESSRLFMYENYCKDVGIPTGFIPKYEDNGNRERCSATVLLERNGCEIKTVKFNQLLIEHGYLEVKERPSSTKGVKTYKSLTEKGLKYGVNLISDKNQKETQPYYYADTFMDLYYDVV